MRNMSWKRIFRTARKVGAPVIISDEEGRKPQVILPLDVYEAMLDEEMDYGIDVPEFDFEDDFEDDLPEEIVFGDDFEDNKEIPEIKFDDSLGDEEFEAVPESAKNGGLKEVLPSENAAPAFEFEDNFEMGGVEPLDIPELKAEPESDKKEINTKDLPKSSEELDMEDRFYFEPIDDEGEGV